MLITSIYWTITNSCKSACTYCPSRIWGGPDPRHIEQYLNFANYAIKHFDTLGRIVNWTFNGGEPLDIFDFPQLLKCCKRSENKIELHSNGGHLWLDWWAIEPYVDILNLTCHKWQNISLVNYVIDLFLKKQKQINVIVPITHNNFDSDYNTAIQLEDKFSISVNKQLLIQNMDPILGYYPYTDEQFSKINGIIPQKNMLGEKTFLEHQESLIKVSPSFSGMRCNEALEKLSISAEGYISGASCGNTHMGNIFEENFMLVEEPQYCKMQYCFNPEDQKILKFK